MIRICMGETLMVFNFFTESVDELCYPNNIVVNISFNVKKYVHQKKEGIRE